MRYALKALQWAYGDSHKYLGFMVATFLFIAALQVALVYPIEVLTLLVVGIGLYALFGFFTGK